MSTLQTASIETINTSINSISVGLSNSIVNSSGIFLDNSKVSVNTSSIKIANNNLSSNIKNISEVSSVTVNNTVYTILNNEGTDIQVFTSNGTWSKPSWATTGNELVFVEVWGAGGSGNVITTGATNTAGGGGGYSFAYLKAGQCNATCNVVVGIGGTSNRDTFFYINSIASVLATGGGNGATVSTLAYGGWGGAPGVADSYLSTRCAVNSPISYDGKGGWFCGNGTYANSIFGGGAGAANGGSSIYGGGGGGLVNAANIRIGGNSVFGGAGGGTNSTNAGISIYGGNGGNTTVQPQMPGGGGGSGQIGANGTVKIYTYRFK